MRKLINSEIENKNFFYKQCTKAFQAQKFDYRK